VNAMERMKHTVRLFSLPWSRYPHLERYLLVAPEGRRNIAPGVSLGFAGTLTTAPEGRKNSAGDNAVASSFFRPSGADRSFRWKAPRLAPGATFHRPSGATSGVYQDLGVCKWRTDEDTLVSIILEHARRIGRRTSMYRQVVVFVCLLVFAASGPAYGQRADPITDNLYAPDLLIRHADEVGLDDAQKQFITSQARDNRQRYVEMQQNLQGQMAALAAIMRQEHPDEQEALTQLDKVLAAEREIKHAQLSMALAIRGKLTPEQQAKARELRQKYAAEMHRAPPSDSMRGKMQQLQERIKKMQEQGRDPSAVMDAVREVRRLMDDGKPREAEAALDRALTVDSDEKK
jgi:hypothetical protein